MVGVTGEICVYLNTRNLTKRLPHFGRVVEFLISTTCFTRKKVDRLGLKITLYQDEEFNTALITVDFMLSPPHPPFDNFFGEKKRGRGDLQ